MESSKALTELTPAEVMVLVGQTPPTSADLLQATYLHLVSRNVLQVIQKQQGGKILRYVGLGPKAGTPNLRKHENGFVKMFAMNSNVSHFLFSQYVKLVRKYSHGSTSFVSDVLGSQSLGVFIKRGFLDRLTGKYSLTPKGLELKAALQRSLSEHQSSFQEGTHRKPLGPALSVETAAIVLLITSPGFRSSWLQPKPATIDNVSFFLGDLSLMESDFDANDGSNESGCWGGADGCSSGDSGCSGGE